MPNKSFRFLFAKYWFLSNFSFVRHNSSGEKQRAFTLIEILIALSILAILSTVGFVGYRNSQIVARDARRKEDMKAIATAVEVYHLRYGRYPCTKGNGVGDPISPATSEVGQQNSSPLWNAAAYPNQPFWLKDTGCSNVLPTDPVGGAAVIPLERPFNQDMISMMPIDPLRDSDLVHPSAKGPYLDIFASDTSGSFGYTFWSPYCPKIDPLTGAPPLPSRYNCRFVPIGTNPGDSYIIWTKMENVHDPDAYQNKHYKTCTGDLLDAYSSAPYDPRLYYIQLCPP